MLQMCLLLCSVLGYCMLIFVKNAGGGRITALYPAIVVSGITLAGFVGGLFDQIKNTYSAVFILGVLLVPLCSIYIVLFRRRITDISFATILPMLCLVAGSIILYLQMNDRFLYSYDDFSHWGSIARLISENQRLATSGDLISFTSYPPGSALFIAYCANIMGSSAEVYLFAQSFMLLAFLLSLFSASEKVWCQVIVTAAVVYLMQYNIRLESLSVDNLLAAAAIAGIMMCLSCRWERIYKIFPALSIVLGTLTLIKNSGFLLALLILGFALFLYFKKKRSFHLRLFCLLVPIAVLLMWNWYTEQTFVEVSKHAMSADYYKSMLEDKQLSGVKETIGIILPLLFRPSYNHALYLIPGYAALLPLLGRNKKHRRVFVFAALLFATYEIGVLLMYVFSMSTSEVIYQNGNDYYRYNGTIVAVLAAILVYLLCQVQPRKCKSIAAKIAAVVVCCMVFCLTMWSLEPMHKSILAPEQRASNYPSIVNLMQIAEAEGTLDEGKAFIATINENDSEEYYGLACAYYLRTDEVTCYNDEERAWEDLDAQPWATYIDLRTGEIRHAKETIGVDLYTQTIGKNYTNVLDQAGYKENMRYSRSSVGDVIAAGWDLTGYIQVKSGDVIHLDGVTWYPSAENEGHGSVYWFAMDKEFLDKIQTTTAESLQAWDPVYDADGHVVQITVPEIGNSNMVYLRLACQDLNTDSVITINEEIED